MPYSIFENYIYSILAENNINTFKTHPNYNAILEHVTQDQGAEYLHIIRNQLSIPDSLIQEFGKINDSIGNPLVASYDNNISISPTSLRYICHACLILSHMKNIGITNVPIVEVGCGYGGLLLAIQFFASRYNIVVTEYNMIDLTSPLLLQQKYLEHFPVGFPVSYHDASKFGEDLEGSNYFIISNYCFSEIQLHFQQHYINILFPKCQHGFITWNSIDVYNIGKNITVVDEYPLTGPKNKYITF